MNKVLSGFAAVAILAAGAFAAGKDSSEKGVPTSNLKIFAGGIGLGGQYAVNKDLRDNVGEAFFQVALAGTWQFRDNVSLFGDASWYYSETAKNYGLDLGVDYLFSTSSIKPFIGGGVGGHYFYRDFNGDGKPAEFSDRFGPSFTGHFGLGIDVTETVQVRLRPTYRIVMNSSFDQLFGVDVSLLFSSRFKNIQKLNY